MTEAEALCRLMLAAKEYAGHDKADSLLLLAAVTQHRAEHGADIKSHQDFLEQADLAWTLVGADEEEDEE